MITQEELKKLLRYEPTTGIFIWLLSSGGCKVGDRAGSQSKAGYVAIQLKGRLYKAHRLVWLYVRGTWPTNHIDHIDGIKNNNRISNLREATRMENMANKGKYVNNTSGFKGVYFLKKSCKWRAYCNVNGQRYHLGYFATPEEATAAYQAFAKEHQGPFYKNST